MSASRVRDLCLTLPSSLSVRRGLWLRYWALVMSHKPHKHTHAHTQSYHQAVCSGGVGVSKGSDMETCLLLHCSEEILGWFSPVTLTLEQLDRRRGVRITSRWWWLLLPYFIRLNGCLQAVWYSPSELQTPRILTSPVCTQPITDPDYFPRILHTISSFTPQFLFPVLPLSPTWTF